MEYFKEQLAAPLPPLGTCTDFVNASHMGAELLPAGPGGCCQPRHATPFEPSNGILQAHCPPRHRHAF